jgi:hypothetical protein
MHTVKTKYKKIQCIFVITISSFISAEIEILFTVNMNERIKSKRRI